MNTDLNDLTLLPLNQPYNSEPWYYDGTEAVTEIPNPDIVDWILVELRDALEASSASSGTVVAQQAALLLNNGSIVGLDGASFLQYDVPIVHQLFAVIWQRNHLAIMSADALIRNTEGLYIYEFSTSASQAYEEGQIHLGDGIYGMIGGDSNADGIINESDAIQTWIPQAGTAGYLSGDINLNGQVNNPDKNDIWFENLNQESQVPE